MGAAYQKGLILFQQHRWKDAADQFEAELQSEPRSPQAHSMIALSLFNQKQLKPAYMAAQTALELDASQWFAHYAMAYVLTRYRPRKASDNFKLSTTFSPVTEQQHVRLRAARKQVLRALELNPFAAD